MKFIMTTITHYFRIDVKISRALGRFFTSSCKSGPYQKGHSQKGLYRIPKQAGRPDRPFYEDLIRTQDVLHDHPHLWHCRGVCDQQVSHPFAQSSRTLRTLLGTKKGLPCITKGILGLVSSKNVEIG